MNSRLTSIIIGVAVIALLVVVSMFFRQAETGEIPDVSRSTVVETPAQKADRLAIMNELNRFHIASVSAKEAPSDDQEEKHLERVERVATVLDKMEVDGSIDPARTDLANAMTNWRETLMQGSDTTEVRAELESVAENYDWLHTVVWLIILNHL